MKTLNHRVKGFTLVEMITVIAIIGVLLGVLAPAMSNYYWKSRVKSANADAKMIYNTAQTEVQKYIAFDRANEAAPSGLKNTMLISFSNQSRDKFRYVTTADVSALKTNPLVTISGTHTASAESAAAAVVSSVNKTVSGADTKCWAIYVNNYIVKASIAADAENTPYVGYYTTGRIALPENRPTTPYYAATGACWLTGSGTDSLANLASRYSIS